MIETSCPHCQREFALADSFAGQTVRCKSCSGVFQVPLASHDDLERVAPPDASQPVYPRKGQVADEIEYEICGSEMQYVVISLDPGETVIAEAGMMMFLDQGIRMDSVFGSAANEGGFWEKLKSAGKRVLTGESLFLTTFKNEGRSVARAAFASPYPGKIVPLHLSDVGGEVICQKDAFLCGAKGIEVEIAFNRRIGVGLFGGEGFIMQRLAGDGLACFHAGGTLLERELAVGETLRVDTGCLVGLEKTVDYDIEFVGGIKNALFSGEGLFLATLTGPGRVWLQSLPFSRLAGRLLGATGALNPKGEGSVLDLTGLGNLFMGDRR